MNNQKNFSEEEWSNRVNLAASYHLADHFQMSDIIWNHITARTSLEKDTFLINNFGLRYDEITASNLLEIDPKGKVIRGDGIINETGYVIHGAIHKKVPNAKCILHVHSKYATALSCLKDPTLPPIDQNTMRFYNRVAIYDDFGGLGFEEE